MAANRAATESPYMRALELQRRRIGDYEKVHFRVPKNETSTVANEIRGGFSSTAQPELQPQVASYSRATSKSYLKQTEAQWLCMNLTRQEATSSLLDHPAGSFFVRSSSNAPYALTVRLPDSDPPVTHFLVYRSTQQNYYIQGSNLQFRDLYDLLSYYSFNKSGGMPCLLRPPKQTVESSDSEDSEDEDDSNKSPSYFVRKQHYYDEIGPRFESQQYQPYSQDFHPPSTSTEVPPPLPPRQSRLLYSKQPPPSARGLELCQAAQRVASYVDTDAGTLLRKLSSRKTSEAYSKHSIPFAKPVESRPTSTASTGGSLEVARPNRNIASTDEWSGVDQSVEPEPLAPPYKNFTIINEQKRSSQNLGSEAPLPYRNFTIIKEHSRIRHSSGSEPSSPYQSPNQVPERATHKELVQPVVGEAKPPLPPRSLPPPIPPRSNRGAADLTRPSSISPPVPSHNAPPLPSHDTPPVPPHNTPPIPSHDAPPIPPHDVPPVPPRTTPPPLPPKRSVPNDSSPLQESRIASPPASAVVKEKETQNYGQPLPDIFPSRPLRRTSSDTSIVSHRSEISDKHKFSPAPLIGGDSLVTSNDSPISDEANHSHPISADWELVSSIPAMVTPLPSWYKPRRKKKTPWSRKLKWPRKPRKRLKSYIRSLAEDTEEEFGWRIHYFCTVTLMRSDHPHQNLISDIRQFINRMREYLLKDHRTELLREGMDSCRNFEHLLESSLQHCIVMPLHNFILTQLEREFSRTGSMQQLKAAMVDARSKAAEDLGLRAHLLPPQDKALQEISAVFTKMCKTYCAMKKLEYLLEAVRLTYEGVRDSNNPKKAMHDLGADDFLPLFVWVLAHCSFETAEIEAEYMWGLAHPSLFNGEGGYYLTTLTSAVNVLKELCSSSSPLGKPNARPSLTDLQTILEIHFEDEETDKFLRTCLLPVIPTMTSSEICDMIAEQQDIFCPEEYVLAVVMGGQVIQALADEDCPQEIKKKWELEDSVPSEKFIAYMKRAHLQDGQHRPHPPTVHEY